MIIDSIKLCGWRSYDSDGICLENLKSINLIIGPNNSGKSNLSKYFHYLKSVADGNLSDGGLMTFDALLEESQTWSWKKEDVSCEISLSEKNDINSSEKIYYKIREHQVDLSCRHIIESNTAALNYKINGASIFSEDGRIYTDQTSGVCVDSSDDVAGFYDNYIHWTSFLDSLVFVDPIRHHSRSSDNRQNFYFDGAMIIEELNKLRSDDSNKSKWVGYKKQITSWLSDILSEEVISVEVSDAGLRLEFKSGLLFSLDELGTGVSQIVMLLSHLWINKDVNLNVFLEEPEANLHPDSVVKLVNVFEKELSKHTFFITTHSPSLIDCLNDNWAVFRTSKLESGASKITPNDNIIKYYETLDALGVKASQILQANTVIWVEGPSDRVYIKKWIEIFSDNKLKEGKDFSFLYFGGTNLASFTILDDIDQNLINMLSTSRKVYLVADSDCASQENRDSQVFKSYLTSLLERFEHANGSKGLDTSVGDYFEIWITDGREIENYVCKDLLYSVLTVQGFLRESIGTGCNRKELELISNQSSDFTFNKFDSFDKAISVCYQYKDGEVLNSSAKRNVALSYAGKKVSIAKAIVDQWDNGRSGCIGLDAQLTRLLEFIRK